MIRLSRRTKYCSQFRFKHKIIVSPKIQKRKPLPLRWHFVRRRKGVNHRRNILARTKRTCAENIVGEKPRKRGILQRKGVPPWRICQDAAAYDAHRRRRPNPQSGSAAYCSVRRELPRKAESRRSANSKCGFSAVSPRFGGACQASVPDPNDKRVHPWKFDLLIRRTKPLLGDR